MTSWSSAGANICAALDCATLERDFSSEPVDRGPGLYVMVAVVDLLGWGAATVSAIGLLSTCLIYLIGRVLPGAAKRAEQSVSPPFRSANEPARGRLTSDRAVERPSHERRCHFRRGGNPTQVAIGHPEDPSELVRGVVVDRSTGGICLEMLTPLAVGAIVSVRPSVATSIGTWVEAEVRHCRRGRGGWHVGFRFVRTPPLSVLWMFG